MEDEYVDEEIVENVTDCPSCGEFCGHEVLKEKKAGEGTDYLLKCEECGHVHTVQIRPPRPIVIPFILSEGFPFKKLNFISPSDNSCKFIDLEINLKLI